jgi:hypothetical protein
MENAVLWDVTPRGSCKNIRFGGTYRLDHQDKKNPDSVHSDDDGSSTILHISSHKSHTA